MPALAFLNRGGEASYSMIFGMPSAEMQLAVSPVKHLLLLGEYKSTFISQSYYSKVKERGSLGIGAYTKIKKNLFLELVHMTRQYAKYSGNTDQVIGNGVGNILASAYGSMNYHQTRLSFYQRKSNYFFGVTLNMVDVFFHLKGGDITQIAEYYIRDEPYQLYGFSVNPFIGARLIGHLHMYFSAALTKTRSIDGVSGHMFTPLSFRFGFNILLNREKTSLSNNSF
ncbi:MAG: hypothetical protein ACK4GL_08285 [Flavobacteriales bacterium]